MKTRGQIAKELLKNVPKELKKDHLIIANAIKQGKSLDYILNMKETDNWPDTYFWIKSELSGSKKKAKKKTKKLGHGPGCTQAATLGKHYKGRSKKKLSPKQKKALSKGRKVLSYLRTGRKASEALEPLLIKEGHFMAAKKKQHRKKARKTYGFEGTRKSHKRRRVSHKVSHVLSGAGRGGFDAGGIAVDLAGLLAGAIGLSFVAGMIPVKNPKLKSAIPIIAGIIGLSMPKLSRNRFINRAALGGLAIGGYSLTKQLAPGLPLMGATDTAEGIGYAIQALPPEEQAILGLLPDYSQQGEYNGNQPGEMLGSQPGEMLGNTEMIEGIPGEMLGDTTEMITSGSDSDFE